MVTLKEYREPTTEAKFMDYLRSGWQINLSVAIDYTLSNEQNYEPSLHQMGPDNQYEKVINMVGGILEPYDYDKLYPVFGFGGKPTMLEGPNAKVSHCFPLTSPCVQGVAGILGVYRETLPSITLSGPTLFAPILQAFLAHVKS